MRPTIIPTKASPFTTATATGRSAAGNSALWGCNAENSNSDFIAAHVSGEVARVTLERSYHVATLDHDKDLIEEEAVAFAQKVATA